MNHPPTFDRAPHTPRRAAPHCQHCGNPELRPSFAASPPSAPVGRAFQESETEQELPGLLDPIGRIFHGVVMTNIASARRISIPAAPIDWRARVLQYARATPIDGAVLAGAFVRAPFFHRGGWILSVQRNAGAMTLGQHVFVRGSLSLSTYVHELVHVFQYGALGASAFLTSYFGASAAVIAYRLARRQPLNAMRSSPHETQAYALEARFDAWHSRTFGASATSITV
jgi:hypothetical protein